MNAQIIDTLNPRAGRRFAPTRELALHGPALQACIDLAMPRRDITVIREMTGPYGIPDLTAVIGGRSILDNRLKCDTPPLLNEIDAAVVGAAHVNAPRSLDSLSKTIGWPTETISRRVPHILRVGGLSEVRTGLYVRPEAIRPSGTVIAVEAKVEDWKKALRQARTYAVWADSYVIVMGKLSENTSRQLQFEVAHDKGGLVIDGTWVQRPQRRNHARGRRLWASEYVLAGLRADYQPSERA